MKSGNRDNSSPYAVSPHRRGGDTKKPPSQPVLGTWTLREMGDTADNNKTITAISLTEAMKIYAAVKWDRKAAFLLPVYVKVVGERYIRCVHPNGQIEIMGW